jgi:hypothetical protein
MMPLRSVSLMLLSFASIVLAQTPQTAIDAGATSAGTFEAQYFRFRYQIPNGWSALPDAVRIEENRKRYETQLADALKKAGPKKETRKTKGGKQITETRTTEVFPPYNLLVAAPAPLTSSDTDQLPSVTIFATKRFPAMMEAGDPAHLIGMMSETKVLRGPAEEVLSGHKFVRADFQFRSDNFLSKFSTVIGNYLVEFDLRAMNEKDLTDLANSMQSVVFMPDRSPDVNP